MTFLMAAFCAGIIILYSYGQLLPWFYYIFVIAILFLVRPGRYSLPILCFVAGAAYANFAAQSHLDKQLPLEWEGKEVFLTGYACSLPVYRGHYSQVDVCAVEMERENGETLFGKRRMKVNWTTQNIDWSHPVHRLRTRLKRPRFTANASGFSYEEYLFYRGISAVGSIKSSALADNDLSLIQLGESFLTRSRIRLSEHLTRQVSEFEYAGLLHALILGDKSFIKKAHADTLKHTGTQHLLAISGLHVGLLMFLLFRILPKTHLALAVVLLSGGIYILLVGFGPSAQRAWIMCSLALLVIRGANARRTWLFFFLAMFLVLLLDPLSALNLGFSYSFFAVALLLCLGMLKLVGEKFGLLIVVQCLLLLGLVLLNTSFLMPQGWPQGLANIVAIPWVSCVVLPIALLSFGFSFFFEGVSALGFDIVSVVLSFLFEFLDALPEYSTIRTEMSALEISTYSIVFIALLILSRWMVLSFYLGVMLFLYLACPKNIEHSDAEVWVMDVGQGLSIFMQVDGRTWLYDLGPAYQRYSSFEGILQPFILGKGYEIPIDGLVLSHGDNDHAGDVQKAISVLKPREVWSGEVSRIGLDNAKACETGMGWWSAGMELEVIFPPEGFEPDSSNNHSCVIKVTMAGVSFLLMGDLEGKAEKALIRRFSDRLKADVLIAGHHGSKNATTLALLKHVQPEWVVFSAGYLNRFGHPHESVTQRVNLVGAKALSTAEAGALHFNVEKGKLNINFVRDKSRPFWMGGPG